MARFRPVMGSRINNQGGASGRALRSDLNRQMSQLLANFRFFREQAEAAAAPAMVEALEPVMDKAIYYAPEDTGELRASAFLTETNLYGQPTVVFGFGKRGKPDYAIFVHEMPYKHEAPTRSKFLTAAVEEDIPGIQRRYAASMRRRVRV